MNRRALLATAFLMIAFLATAFLAIDGAAAGAGDAAVMIDNFTFAPAEITVPVGTRVVWTNRDDIPHTVTDADNPRTMKSAPLDTDDTFAFTFDKAGTFRYFCSLHPHMQGDRGGAMTRCPLLPHHFVRRDAERSGMMPSGPTDGPIDRRQMAVSR